MDNVIEIVALLRKHSELELQILNGHGAAVVMEQEVEATVRRLAAHPQALNASPSHMSICRCCAMAELRRANWDGR